MPSMKYVFGPVPSRRLGRSLGIDPTPPPRFDPAPCVGPCDRPATAKTCNWNCVYCQLGRTRPFTRSRFSSFPPDELLTEVREALREEPAGSIDWITFVGSGEPLLNRDMGKLIEGVKSLTVIPVAVITNGSLLGLPGPRAELAAADAVMPTLDAGSPALFRRINRPPAELSFERHVEGLAAFRKEYRGRLWLEVMLIDGVNDGEAALRELAAVVARIAPDEVHLVLPTRPPTEAWVHPASAEASALARSMLGEAARVVMPDERRGGFGTETVEDPLTVAASIVARHPMSVEELRSAIARWGAEDPDAVIDSLIATGSAVAVEREGRRFLRGV